jgi:hypothetical protein
MGKSKESQESEKKRDEEAKNEDGSDRKPEGEANEGEKKSEEAKPKKNSAEYLKTELLKTFTKIFGNVTETASKIDVRQVVGETKEVMKELLTEIKTADDVNLPNKEVLQQKGRRRRKIVEANEAAGAGITIRPKSAWEEQWEKMQERASKSRIFTSWTSMKV